MVALSLHITVNVNVLYLGLCMWGNAKSCISMYIRFCFFYILFCDFPEIEEKCALEKRGQLFTALGGYVTSNRVCHRLEGSIMLSIMNFKGFLEEVHSLNGHRMCWTKQNWRIQDVKWIWHLWYCIKTILCISDYRHIFIFSKAHLKFYIYIICVKGVQIVSMEINVACGIFRQKDIDVLPPYMWKWKS